MKKIIIYSIFLIYINSNAQKFELGKVTKEELQEKVHPLDANANAAILFQTGQSKIDFNILEENFVLTTTVQTKIKIYTKEGYDWANKIVKYYNNGNSKEGLSFDDAYTYNLVDGKIEKTKLKNDGIFDEKINKFWGRKKIAMPNVKVGSIIEFEYTIISPNFFNLKEWDFQNTIPVNFSEFKTYTPEFYVFKSNLKGFITPKTLVEKKSKTVTINKTERGSTSLNRGGTTSQVSESFDYIETKTIYTATNVPALKDEAFVNNIENYTSSISNEITSVQFRYQPLKNFSTDWASVAKRIYENDDFGGELNKTGYFEDDIKILLKDVSTPEEKIGTIFNFVKNKVKWDNYTDYTCNEGVKKAYKDHTGNIAEINLMLTAMLRFAGLDANPVLVSTRDHGIALFPSMSGFNYVISSVKNNEEIVLLDASEIYSTPNVLPLRDLNWFGRLIRKDGTSDFIELTPKTLSREVNNATIKLSNLGVFEGQMRKQYSNHSALEFRKKYNLVAKESYLEELEGKNNAILIADYVRENEKDLSEPIVELFNFKDSKSVEIINNKIYFSPLLFLSMTENPFKQENREYPVDFGYPIQKKYNFSIEIPDGYTIETLPKAFNTKTEDNSLIFKYNILNSENKIQIVVSTDINTAIVSADYYSILKNFFQKAIDKQNEKIVLVKNK